MSEKETKDQKELLNSYIEAITHKIDKFLQQEINYWSTIDPSIAPPLRELSTFFHGGGKRLRPAFCYLGYLAESDGRFNDEIIDAGCALELLHNFALVHDDFMDRADTRRSIPTVHKALEKYYLTQNYHGDIEHFSNSVAILAGDFAFTYADRFARNLPVRCLDVYDVLKVELFAGQQMDLDAVYRKSISKESVSLIAQYKSGKYTIERPLQLGALLGNEKADEHLWSDFGSPLGEAFQLRDDVLGIYGDEKVTGKPVGDDIREGKFTLLIAEAIERAGNSELEVLSKRGNPEITNSEIDEIVEIIDSSGAREAVEQRIKELYELAMISMEKLDLGPEAKELALYLSKYVCWREL